MLIYGGSAIILFAIFIAILYVWTPDGELYIMFSKFKRQQPADWIFCSTPHDGPEKIPQIVRHTVPAVQSLVGVHHEVEEQKWNLWIVFGYDKVNNDVKLCAGDVEFVKRSCFIFFCFLQKPNHFIDLTIYLP